MRLPKVAYPPGMEGLRVLPYLSITCRRAIKESGANSVEVGRVSKMTVGELQPAVFFVILFFTVAAGVWLGKGPRRCPRCGRTASVGRVECGKCGREF